jgi:hypothetical protein
MELVREGQSTDEKNVERSKNKKRMDVVRKGRSTDEKNVERSKNKKRMKQCRHPSSIDKGIQFNHQNIYAPYVIEHCIEMLLNVLALILILPTF